jgi:hypothetical protein
MKNKNGISGITLIVSAVIGLIIIVVVVMMVTSKLGAFGKGVDKAGDTAKTCEEQGGEIKTKSLGCGNKELVIAGDTLVVGKICCKSTGYSQCMSACETDKDFCERDLGPDPGCTTEFDTCKFKCGNR